MPVWVDPPNWKEMNLNTVQVDSGAGDNVEAIREIDEWAYENGFARTTEYWLRRIRREDGSFVFRGFCYRVTQEVEQSKREAHERLVEAVSRQSETASHIEKSS